HAMAHSPALLCFSGALSQARRRDPDPGEQSRLDRRDIPADDRTGRIFHRHGPRLRAEDHTVYPLLLSGHHAARRYAASLADRRLKLTYLFAKVSSLRPDRLVL